MKKLIYVVMACLTISNCAQAQKVEITPNGIGAIKVGGKVANMPAKVDGLYDAITQEQKEDMGDTYTCYQFVKNGQVVAQIDDFSFEGDMSAIEILSADFAIAGISVGTPIAQVFSNPKAKQEMLRDGSFRFVIGGVMVNVGELSEAGFNKIRDAYSKGVTVPLTLSDFESNAAVKSIVCVGQ